VKKVRKPPGDPGSPESNAAEWNGTMVRGLAALEFLERSSDMAAERVVAVPVSTPAAEVRADEDSAEALLTSL
jgi:hypothetical protein